MSQISHYSRISNSNYISDTYQQVIEFANPQGIADKRCSQIFFFFSILIIVILAYIYIVSFFQPWLMKPIAELADAVK
jgi:uncharacterized membrane protein (DUF485 family)